MDGLPDSVSRQLEALFYDERAAAWLQIDADFSLAGAGGHLAAYGLGSLRWGQPAAEQAVFLEGLIPIEDTTYFVPSVEVVGGRVADLHFLTEDGTLWVLMLDVTAERDATRRLQQRAYEMTLLHEQEAQLNRRLEATNAALVAAQRDLEASRAALARSHNQLKRELNDAALYVRSLLPKPMTEPFTVAWRFEPSTALGGDAFGYHWIDPQHFAFYLLDVCGHGIGPSLLSVAALHVLDSGSLRDVDFRQPDQVLAGLNETYQMRGDNDQFFTLWYGVFQPETRRLVYGCAGHPPAVLVEPGSAKVERLDADGLPIGMISDVNYATATITVPPGGLIYVLSDGAFEVERIDGTMLTYAEFIPFLARSDSDPEADLDRVYRHLQGLGGRETLADDFSIMRLAL